MKKQTTERTIQPAPTARPPRCRRLDASTPRRRRLEKLIVVNKLPPVRPPRRPDLLNLLVTHILTSRLLCRPVQRPELLQPLLISLVTRNVENRHANPQPDSQHGAKRPDLHVRVRPVNFHRTLKWSRRRVRRSVRRPVRRPVRRRDAGGEIRRSLRWSRSRPIKNARARELQNGRCSGPAPRMQAPSPVRACSEPEFQQASPAAHQGTGEPVAWPRMRGCSMKSFSSCSSSPTSILLHSQSSVGWSEAS